MQPVFFGFASGNVFRNTMACDREAGADLLLSLFLTHFPLWKSSYLV